MIKIFFSMILFVLVCHAHSTNINKENNSLNIDELKALGRDKLIEMASDIIKKNPLLADPESFNLNNFHSIIVCESVKDIDPSYNYFQGLTGAPKLPGSGGKTIYVIFHQSNVYLPQDLENTNYAFFVGAAVNLLENKVGFKIQAKNNSVDLAGKPLSFLRPSSHSIKSIDFILSNLKKCTLTTGKSDINAMIGYSVLENAIAYNIVIEKENVYEIAFDDGGKNVGSLSIDKTSGKVKNSSMASVDIEPNANNKNYPTFIIIDK